MKTKPAPVNHLPTSLYQMPSANTTLTAKQLRETLLATDGRVFVSGRLCDIRSKAIGAGVYRVWLETAP